MYAPNETHVKEFVENVMRSMGLDYVPIVGCDDAECISSYFYSKASNMFVKVVITHHYE